LVVEPVGRAGALPSMADLAKAAESPELAAATDSVLGLRAEPEAVSLPDQERQLGPREPELMLGAGRLARPRERPDPQGAARRGVGVAPARPGPVVLEAAAVDSVPPEVVRLEAAAADPAHER
jgi:hypothetical protein